MAGTPAGAARRSTNAAIGTAPPVALLSRDAISSDGVFLPLRISERYGLDNPASLANRACVVLPSIHLCSGCSESDMAGNLAIGEYESQDGISLTANSMPLLPCRQSRMGRTNRNDRSKTPRRLFLGPWLIRLKRKQSELAAAVGITPTYASELVNDPSKNPSPAVLLDISEFLGLTVNDLYQMPPSSEAVDAAGQLNPAQIATLGRLLDQMKPGKRR